MKTSETGRLGELEAARFLEKNGYGVILQNYRTRLGEIDIIAKNGEYIVFAEVKTRAKGSLLLPREAVDRHKQLRIIRAAEQYLCENTVKLQPRFDVIEVTTDGGEIFRAVKIRHLENAFTL